ncbi:gustatory receptor for sugar taste 43a-like [Epargyreus clarus]|uniref:gustatory receptor for sugar taste 43a-like n=1 Tax=Epargyreus clarus TaxID=520877 RepID=UPI003C2E2D9E
MLVLVACLYGAYYISHFIGVVVGAQIVFLIYDIHAAMEVLNEELERILSNIHETRSLNKAEEASLRRISILYGVVSDTVGYFNKDDGALVLLKFTTYNVYLMFTAYYFYNILSQSGNPASSTQYYLIMLNAIWCTAHITGMLVYVEPCHQTLQEVEKYRVLLTDLMYRTQPPGEPSSLCVDVLYKQLVFDPLTFSPLGVCTITRSLLTAAISTLTTCLVIVVQYRLGNVKKAA